MASINGSTGVLTPSSTVDNLTSDGIPTSIAVHSSGKFVYVTDNPVLGGGSVRGYTRDGTTGALTPMTGNPFASESPLSFAIGPDGKSAYVPVSNGIWVYSIDGTSGALTPIAGSPFSASPGGDSVTYGGGTTLAIDPSGAFACAERNADISVYRINGTTGALTAVTGSPFAVGTIPSAIAIK